MKIYNVEQGSEEWKKLRAGIITGTTLGDVIGGPKAQLTAIYSLIAGEFAPLEEQFTSFAMQRGTDLEPIAKAKYIDITKEQVEEVGFIKSGVFKDEYGEYLGLSPDGIIYKDGIIKKAIEVKCPGAKNHSKYIIENKVPDEYFEQIINYFLVIDDLQELDFISYHPDFYIGDKKLHIINIKRSDLEKEIEKAKDKILEFRKKWIENIKILQG